MSQNPPPTALIAEDEPLLAGELRDELARAWPELDVCAVVHDGHAVSSGACGGRAGRPL